MYIPPDDVKALDILDTVVHNILCNHSRVLISIYARSSLWDDSCVGMSSFTPKFSNGFEVRGDYLKTWSAGT